MSFMSQVLIQPELAQPIVKQELKASQILRATKVRQIREMYLDGKGGYCAVGAIRHYFGWSGEQDKLSEAHYKTVTALNGAVGHVIVLNDAGKSFDEIADVLEVYGL